METTKLATVDFLDKYKPTKDTIKGDLQKQIVKVLLEKLERGIITQKVMLIGNSGVGKTSIAEIYGRRVVGDNTSALVEVNCGASASVNDVRALLPQIEQRSIFSSKTVFFFDEIHNWSGKAQDAILTPLEKLSDHVVIIAGTSEPHKLTPALRSRFGTNLYYLKSPSKEEQAELVREIFKEEDVFLSRTVGLQILEMANGNIREVVGYCQQVIEGTFRYIEPSSPDNNVLLAELLSNKPNLSKISECELTNNQLVGICKWAMRNMKNPKAVRIIEVFGGGLSQTMPEDVAFMSLVVKYVNG